MTFCVSRLKLKTEMNIYPLYFHRLHAGYLSSVAVQPLNSLPPFRLLIFSVHSHPFPSPSWLPSLHRCHGTSEQVESITDPQQPTPLPQLAF